jgi:hypothetical protein
MIVMSENLNHALILLDRALEEIEVGFVACSRCGDQEDTKNLDCVDDIKLARAELLAFLGKDIPNKGSVMEDLIKELSRINDDNPKTLAAWSLGYINRLEQQINSIRIASGAAPMEMTLTESLQSAIDNRNV